MRSSRTLGVTHQSAKPNATTAPSGVTLPATSPFKGQTQPDLAGNANGLDPAYFKFPSQLTQTVAKPPGDGSDVSAIVVLTYSPPPGADQNAAWQAVNKQLGVNLKLQMVPSADYAAAVNTVLAGSDISGLRLQRDDRRNRSASFRRSPSSRPRAALT